MAKLTCRRKLQVELRAFLSSPPPFLPLVAVDENDICTWHYLLQGPPDTPYEGGWYIGKLRFPNDYPFAPPSIMMLTPSGRFKPNTRLCLSISDFHPESWNPMWGVAAVLTGLLSFMLEETPTTGAVEGCSVVERRALAADSVRFNMATPSLRALFPDLPRMAEEARAKREAEKDGGKGASGGVAAAVATVTGALAKALSVGGAPAPAPMHALGEAAGAAAAEEGGGAFDARDGGDDAAAAVPKPVALDDGLTAATVRALAASRAALAAAAPEAAREMALEALEQREALYSTAAVRADADVEAAAARCRDRAALLRAAAAAAVACGELVTATALLQDPVHVQAGPACAAAAAAGAAAAVAAERGKAAGNEAFKRRDWDAAVAAYRQGLQSAPTCAALHANVAAALGAAGEVAGAEAAARAALALQEGHHKARRRLADALLARGAPDEAAKHYAQLKAAFPADAALRAAAAAAEAAAVAAAAKD